MRPTTFAQNVTENAKSAQKEIVYQRKFFYKPMFKIKQCILLQLIQTMSADAEEFTV